MENLPISAKDLARVINLAVFYSHRRSRLQERQIPSFTDEQFIRAILHHGVSEYLGEEDVEDVVKAFQDLKAKGE